MEKEIYNIVSFSGGKDSTAMLLRMIEEKMQIDCILFSDTTIEFPQMYEHIDKVEKNTGLKITRVRAPHTFEYMMFDKPIKRHEDSIVAQKCGIDQTGYGWAGPRMRWCTRTLKTEPREKYVRELRKKYDLRFYIGIAADEQYRLERKNNQSPDHVHPLVEWGMTESDCLEYCYSKGYDWGGLYTLFKRVSCWCCPLQPLEELRILRTHFPDLWAKLIEWDDKNFRTFKEDYSVRDLDVRFQFEEERLKMGLSIRGKEFMTQLRTLLEQKRGMLDG